MQDIVAGADPGTALDVQLSASGFKPRDATALERWAAAAHGPGCGSEGPSSGEDSASEEEQQGVGSSEDEADGCAQLAGLQAHGGIRGLGLQDEQADGQYHGG